MRFGTEKVAVLVENEEAFPCKLFKFNALTAVMFTTALHIFSLLLSLYLLFLVKRKVLTCLDFLEHIEIGSSLSPNRNHLSPVFVLTNL